MFSFAPGYYNREHLSNLLCGALHTHSYGPISSRGNAQINLHTNSTNLHCTGIHLPTDEILLGGGIRCSWL